MKPLSTMIYVIRIVSISTLENSVFLSRVPKPALLTHLNMHMCFWILKFFSTIFMCSHQKFWKHRHYLYVIFYFILCRQMWLCCKSSLCQDICVPCYRFYLLSIPHITMNGFDGLRICSHVICALITKNNNASAPIMVGACVCLRQE